MTTSAATRLTTTTAVVNLDVPGARISRDVYGYFAEHLGRCIYDGFYVGEDSAIPNVGGIRTDIVEALRALDIPNPRWPGGCFADEYHWRDGIGPKESRPSMVNTNWGNVIENNHFGTHEFLALCELLGTEPYIAGNVGSGTVQEMSEWVEYLTRSGDSPMSRLRRENGRDEPWTVKFWGLGNEARGCGGNMRAEHYADLARQYATYYRDHGDNKLYRIAAGACSGPTPPDSSQSYRPRTSDVRSRHRCAQSTDSDWRPGEDARASKDAGRSRGNAFSSELPRRPRSAGAALAALGRPDPRQHALRVQAREPSFQTRAISGTPGR